MVFESTLSSVLNKFLGDFVENLDGKQLSLGIWGGIFFQHFFPNKILIFRFLGDVELRNLIIKPSALDDLDLPIQIVYGSIGKYIIKLLFSVPIFKLVLGKLLLKIPWKSLYSSPWVIEVDDILVLTVPNQQVKYDPIKEEKIKLDAKNKELRIIEEAKKAEAEKG